MITYTVEVTRRIPEFVHLTIEATTPEEAIASALARVADHRDRLGPQLDYDTCDPDVVTALWLGDRDYPDDPEKWVPLPPTPLEALTTAIEAAVAPVREGWAVPVALRKLLAALDKWKDEH
jgi:hypothetical protein